MFRGVAVPFAMFLVVVVVVCIVPSLAAPPVPHCLTHQELIRSIMVNRLAILKGMNESTSFFASHGDELNQLREDMEKEWQAMNETVVEGMKEMNEIMNETLLRQVTVLSETLENETKILNGSSMAAMKEMNNKIESMNGTLQTGITALTETMKNDIQRMNETGKRRTIEINDMNSKINVIDNNVERGMRELAEELNSKINEMNHNVQILMYEARESRTREINDMNNKIDMMNNSVASIMRALIEELNTKTDVVNGNVNRWMAEMNENLEAVQNAAAVHHYRPDAADLFVNHNDTLFSLCDGHKVLFGSTGVLRVTSSGNYTNNMNCSWTVTLPEGSRPVFSWHYFDIEKCNGCNCDYVYIKDVDHLSSDKYCGKNPPDGSYLTVMNNKFIVKFHSDGSVTGRGFNLWYRSVEMN